MAPRIDDSDSDSDSDSSPGSPVRGRSSGKLPAIDFAAADPKLARRAQPSQKQKENQNRDDASKDAQLAALKKQIKNLQKKNEQTKAKLQERDAEHAPPESEEEDDPVDMSAFSNSFKSRGVVSQTAPKTAPKKLRKSGETPIVTPMSRVPLSEIGDQSNLVADKDINEDLDDGAGDGDGDALSSEHDNLHKRPRSPSPPPLKKTHKRSKLTVELVKAEFVAGKAPTGSRTNLKDYTEPAGKLIKRAMHKYEVLVWTRKPYPGGELQIQSVKAIWDEVCAEASERMASMIKKYGSHGRSSMNANVRPLIASTYGFKAGDSAKTIKQNVKLYKTLLDESGFHYEDTKERKGYAKNPIIINAIRTNWFKNKSGRGVLYVDYFSPISLVTLALIFTAIEFCIEEYSTGRHQQGIFDEAHNKDRYDVHFQDLTDWAALKPSVTNAVLQQMHDQCRASTGAALVKPAGRMTDTARARALAELEAMEIDDDGNDDDDQ
ncbi:hypothetical protein B0H19DRAFT_1238375 [Mycena capillaripes]|nr:hypothetical protein B0H19DRAFT_1238375 [Mycena capillaripes]